MLYNKKILSWYFHLFDSIKDKHTQKFCHYLLKNLDKKYLTILFILLIFNLTTISIQLENNFNYRTVYWCCLKVLIMCKKMKRKKEQIYICLSYFQKSR